jgi:hypothetical protein
MTEQQFQSIMRHRPLSSRHWITSIRRRVERQARIAEIKCRAVTWAISAGLDESERSVLALGSQFPEVPVRILPKLLRLAANAISNVVNNTAVSNRHFPLTGSASGKAGGAPKRTSNHTFNHVISHVNSPVF